VVVHGSGRQARANHRKLTACQKPSVRACVQALAPFCRRIFLFLFFLFLGRFKARIPNRHYLSQDHPLRQEVRHCGERGRSTVL
jgi:hypothetical protein